MRLLRFSRNLNWRHIIGEVLLIFISINLAIWFNDWSASNKSARDKQTAISKIREEIKNNLEELSDAGKKNQTIRHAVSDFEALKTKESGDIIATPAQIATLGKKYPGFFTAVDSSAVTAGVFKYVGENLVNFEIVDLTGIAWETTRSINIAKEFSYECLYGLESLYRLQQRVQNEVDKVANALQRRELDEAIVLLEFLDQLERPLIEEYQAMLEKIDQCH